MKPKEYIKRHGPTESYNEGQLYTLSSPSPSSQIFVDFSSDFLAQVEYHSSRQWNLSIFRNLVNQMREKFDLIKDQLKLDEAFWKRFYARTVCPVRDQYFSAEIERKRAEAQKRKEDREAFERAMSGFIHELLVEALLHACRVPTSAFAILGLSPNADADEVNDRFRELAKIHHPDKGGSAQAFTDLMSARNQCLAYLHA